ncbi:hypothetical protein [Streptomyces phaeochromogenes]
MLYRHRPADRRQEQLVQSHDKAAKTSHVDVQMATKLLAKAERMGNDSKLKALWSHR